MIRFFLIICLFFSSAFATSNAPPPASDIFQLTAKRYDPNTLILNWQVKQGFFLYQQSIRLVEPPSEARYATILPIKLPKALEKKDTKGHAYKIYREKLNIPVNIIAQHAGETIVQIKYQGCADDGYCYPPQTQSIKLTFDTDLALNQITLETPEINAYKNNTTLKARLSNPFDQQYFIVTLLIFYTLGLLLSFTPCVLPMVPVLSGVIVGRGQHLTTRHAFGLSFTYVFSMSITYAIVGGIISQVGKNLQALFQTPLTIGLLSGLFVALALSMFNLFELRLPAAWQAKLAQISHRNAHGHYLNAVVLGFLSTLILSPCVTAPLIGALSYIAETGNLFLGISALFTLGLGMGTPLLLIGTSLGRILPHAGAWMNQVKGVFGLILIGVAIDLLSRITPALFNMLLWATLFIFSGIYLGVFKQSKSNIGKIRQVVALILFVHGFLILIGASQGHQNPWTPLSNTISHQKQLTITTLDELQQELAKAKNHQPVLIDFYADWCRSCKIIESELQTDQHIQSLLEKFNVIRVDITDENQASAALRAFYHVIAPPTFIFITKDGRQLNELTHFGEISMPELEELLQQTMG